MRLIGSLKDEKQAFALYSYLTEKGIRSMYEPVREEAGYAYQIWVYDEDQFDEAAQIYVEFTKDPSNKKFKSTKEPPPVDETAEELITASKIQDIKQQMQDRAKLPKPSMKWTKILVLICVIFFLINTYQNVTSFKEESEQIAFTTLDEALLYDFPYPTKEITVEEVEKQQFWPGFYYILSTKETFKKAFSYPMFVKIRQGQIWRLVTPIFLHAGILHILFNMLWLWLLGKQVEERAGVIRYLSLILVIAVISNTLQYLMSGFAFLGFSGVICGLAGYIWIRQKLAPWEGYPMPRATAFFLAIFVVGLALLQLIGFVLTFFEFVSLPINIANTAHVSGAITGMILAKIPVFSR